MTTQDAPTIIGETAGFNLLPGSSTSFGTDNDQVRVTFSGEAQLRNTSDSFDWIEVEVRLDGVPMEPHGAAGDPFAFSGGEDYVSASNQFCRRVAAGTHTVAVYWRLVDNAPVNNSLSGWLDDWSVNVDVNA